MKKRSLYILTLLAACACPQLSARNMSPVAIDSISYDRNGDNMVLQMNLDLTPTKVSSYRAQVITPMIVSDNGDTLALHSVGVYGRTRYINYERNGRHPLGGEDEQMVRVGERPASMPYVQYVPWQGWMDNSEVVIRRQLFGCTNCLLEQTDDTVADYFSVNPAIPEIVYFPAPNEGPKTESLEGHAFIDFVVNTTDIRPSYRNNTYELGKIQATIDTLINDPDVKVTGVWLKGFASPESPYSHNRDLAIGRTAALKRYIGQLYAMPDNVIDTDFEPEDWAGLRRAVVKSNIDNREAILELIDSDLEPDAKEAKIKRQYPEQYKFMLQNYYPALRHTDYRITYEIKRFDDIDKIREVMRTHPSRLSLREFYLLGNASVPGSDEFNDIYETAVRMYPDSEVANINAANAAMQRRDYDTAGRYLDRAGSSAEAIYARGALAFLQGDYDTSERLMRDAESIAASQSTIDEINRIRSSVSKYKQTNVILN